ncbi:DJ-1/PfpI family protein [bacterium]|nr:DJ-1/PfpI family protein [bacterium]
MPKVLFVIAPENFRDEEYFEPKEVLEEGGFAVETASLKTGEIVGAGGETVEATLLVKEVNPQEYEAVVFVGGPGMVELVDNPEFISLAKKFKEAGKIVGAICVAPAILANAGLLKGISATCWEGANETLLRGGANLVNKPVVWAGKIVTANGPASAREFGETLLRALKEA